MIEKFMQVCMMIGLIINILTVNYYVQQRRKNKNLLPETQEHNRKAIWKHSLWAASCAFLSIPNTTFRGILLIALINIGMWKLVSYLRYQIFHRLEISTERERLPN